MHSGSMSLLGYPAECSGTFYRTNSYVPVSPSVAFCSSGVSPTFGFCLPSKYQGNLWLLDNCQETYGGMPSCKSPSCETKTCITSWDPSNCYVRCNSSSVGEVHTACKTTNIGPSPSCSPRTQTKGYVSHCWSPKACEILSKGSQCLEKLNCLSKSFRPLHHCRLGSVEYRSSQNLGFIPSGFSPSCYVASSCPSQKHLMRNCQYPSYRPISCQPLSYFSRNFWSLSYMPSTFPPLRYLCSGCRPLNCY
ncbi:keratin associated protein 24-1 [Rhinolophus ferrumequinum]|uniref:Keratin-associated protein n=1 Tax=Rhinolophus ferrumequinum TaxID=59479 RepID=A0A671EN93_RHIFE|nr:keratin-associated protein 24-1 [Rhinolophus ferrumequinum]KAF6384911.1 keratin associated protein 24-1 [Rhinolophus ferrumequinum]